MQIIKLSLIRLAGERKTPAKACYFCGTPARAEDFLNSFVGVFAGSTKPSHKTNKDRSKILGDPKRRKKAA